MLFTRVGKCRLYTYIYMYIGYWHTYTPTCSHVSVSWDLGGGRADGAFSRLGVQRFGVETFAQRVQLKAHGFGGLDMVLLPSTLNPTMHYLWNSGAIRKRRPTDLQAAGASSAFPGIQEALPNPRCLSSHYPTISHAAPQPDHLHASLRPSTLTPQLQRLPLRQLSPIQYMANAPNPSNISMKMKAEKLLCKESQF